MVRCSAHGALQRPAALMVALVLVIDLSNHYSRDVLGSLQRELEVAFRLSATQYHALTSVYFLASIPAPLVAGFAASAYGAARVQLAAVALAGAGSALHLVGVLPASSPSFAVLLASRFCLGVSYEVIDSVWMPLLEPFVGRNSWTTIAGIVNASQRAGSTLAFGLSPALHRHGGVRLATAVPALLSLMAFAPAALAAAISRSRPQAVVISTPRALRSALVAFDARFWAFFVSCVLLYSSIVPFWYMGSKLLQQRYSLSLDAADWLIVLPELCILVGAPLVGVAADALRLSFR
eukprot:728774-Prymnesium_polylepis.1